MATDKPDAKSGRRTFLKTVAAAGAAGASAQETKTAPAKRAPAKAARKDAGAFPREFSGRQLQTIAFPLGGVGAGAISLGGRGQLRDWEVFNRPDKGRSPEYAFPSIWVSGGAKPFAAVLEARLMPPYDGESGLGSANVPGLPRLESAVFHGSYPSARVEFRDTRMPVRVALEAFSPFIPLEADDSGLPLAVLRYRVKNASRTPRRVAIAFSIENPLGSPGRVNEFRRAKTVSGLLMHDPLLSRRDPMLGSFALAALDQGADLTFLRGWQGGTGWRVGALHFWDAFSSEGRLGAEAGVRSPVGSLCLNREVAAGGEATYTFLLAWYFPNRTADRCGWSAPKGLEHEVIGNHYCTRFKNAWDVLEQTAPRLEELETKTRRFVAAVQESTVPAAIKDAATANLSTLAATTCFRTSDGTLRGFEGVNNRRGCCFGSCTHVWNYQTAVAHVFPALSRSMREAAFLGSTDEHGLMSFREMLPHGKQVFGVAAADGQMGQLLHLYVDYKLYGDREWLRKLWPSAKKTLEFAWIESGWDADRDGVMEGVQHNTYDVEFYGPNPLCGVWYLGALRACEEMAKAVGDTAFADECHRLFERGSQWVDENLFNGEYYVQKVRGIPRDKIAKGLMAGMGAANTEQPDFQVGDGCLVDQLLGQYMAHVAGLGDLLKPANIRKSLDSVYRYNYKRNLFEHASVQRVYVLNDEPAVVVCDYPHGKRPDVPFPYNDEAWTGLEYFIAALMIYGGYPERGIEFVENVRRRYDGERRNPWNEPECGHHYARAMSSWSTLLAASGFNYDGAARRLEVAPRLPAPVFRSFWSTATGWGTFEAAGPKLRIEVAHGELPIREVRFAGKTSTVREGFAAAPGRPFVL